MTDAETGKQTVARTVAYIESVSKEARKPLTSEFNQNHKGIAFKTVPQILQKTALDWFSRRDKTLKISHESTNVGKLGEVRMVFQGETKKVRFKVHLHATFLVNGASDDAPSFIKDVNLFVDPREFSL